MESGKIEPEIVQQKEIKLVKKGLIYYLVKLIVFPFILLFKLLGMGINYLKPQWNLVKQYPEIERKRKKLNKLLSIRHNDEEVL